MTTQPDNDKIDELLSKTINTGKPQFDAEMWKQKYPDEYQALISRIEKAASLRQSNILKVIFAGPAIHIAAAAAVIILVGLLLSRDRQNLNGHSAEPPAIAQSPAEIISMASMRIAYQRGGFDALDKQFRDTLDVLGPRSSSVSMQELL